MYAVIYYEVAFRLHGLGTNLYTIFCMLINHSRWLPWAFNNFVLFLELSNAINGSKIH